MATCVISSSEPANTPPITRPCPSMALVAEETEISAPCFKGCEPTGDSRLLSTTKSAPMLCANSAKASKSATSPKGLEGVSKNSSLVLALTAAFHSSTSVGDTWLTSMPNLVTMLLIKPTVVPNRLRLEITWSPACRKVKNAA